MSFSTLDADCLFFTAFITTILSINLSLYCLSPTLDYKLREGNHFALFISVFTLTHRSSIIKYQLNEQTGFLKVIVGPLEHKGKCGVELIGREL